MVSHMDVNPRVAIQIPGIDRWNFFDLSNNDIKLIVDIIQIFLFWDFSVDFGAYF